MPRTSGSHIVNTPHGLKTKNENENLENLITRQKTTRTSRVQKMRPRTITRGPKSYLSAHHDPKKKKEFDNATETLTRSALRPQL